MIWKGRNPILAPGKNEGDTWPETDSGQVSPITGEQAS